MCTRLCVKGDFRHAGEMCLSKAWDTLCVQTKEDPEEGEGTAEACGQGCVGYQIPCAQCDEVYIRETGRPRKAKVVRPHAHFRFLGQSIH